MKVLLVGDGAREHAIAEAAVRWGARLYAVGSSPNPGIARLSARYIQGDHTDPGTVVRAAEEVEPDLVVVGPEEPLFRGVADALRDRGFAVLGASAIHAEIERRKDFARGLMWRHRIPGRLVYAVFADPEEAARYAKYLGRAALKPVRQAGGKGVHLARVDLEYLGGSLEASARAQARAEAGALRGFNDVDGAVLVEEAVWGVEYTVQAFVGGGIVAAPPVQDNPHSFEFGVGPECGGMGSVSPLPFITDEEVGRTVEIMRRVVGALEAETGRGYLGVLSAQMMLTVYGPTVVEFYARLGDPEAVNLFALLESDPLDLMERAADGRVAGYRAEFRDAATIVKAIAPVGYPHRRDLARGRPVEVDWDVVRRAGCTVYFGSVREDGGRYVTLGSRAFEVLAVGETYADAYQRAERCAAAFRGPVYHRSDIGSPGYMEAMRARAEQVRGAYTWRLSRGLGTRRVHWEPGKRPITYDYS